MRFPPTSKHPCCELGHGHGSALCSAQSDLGADLDNSGQQWGAAVNCLPQDRALRQWASLPAVVAILLTNGTVRTPIAAFAFGHVHIVYFILRSL